MFLLATIASLRGETRDYSLGGGDVLRTFVTYGNPGSCQLVRLDHKRVAQRLDIQIPKGSWAETDEGKTRPVALLIRASRPRQPLLFLSLEEESGVYGYRKVQVLRLNCSKSRSIEPRLLGNFEFSDFGSWMLAKKNSILTWDADLSMGPHEGAHPYEFRWLRIGQHLTQDRTEQSQKKYNPGWSPDGSRPTSIQAVNDPLRELGMRWHWWGDQSIDKTLE